METSIGRVVRSLAGRDKGKFLTVVEVLEDGYLVCDGKERPLVRPKKKNPRHLAPTNFVLSAEEMATDRRLRAALSKLGAEPVEEVI